VEDGYLAQEIVVLQAVRWQAEVSRYGLFIPKRAANLSRRGKWTDVQMMRSRNGFSESYEQLRNESHKCRYPVLADNEAVASQSGKS
jgi:hypothetical protein